MSSEDRDQDEEIRRLREELAGHRREMEASAAHGVRQDELIERLRREAATHDRELATIEAALAAAELELDDLRAVRDALTPPELPPCPGLGLAASFAPAVQQVSGDFYLTAAAPDEATVIVIGDVAGKGIEAARQAVFVRTTFASIARFSGDPAQLLAWTNTALSGRKGYAARFATAACVTFSPRTRTIRWALAGHPPPMWMGSGEELLGRPGPPLGVVAEFDCEVQSRVVDDGAGVVLYTDGLVEARRGRELFGFERLSELIRAESSRLPRDLVDHLRAEATAFGGGELSDDLCVVAARVDPASAL